MKSVHPLLLTLAVAFVGQVIVIAQDPPAPPAPPPAPAALELTLPNLGQHHLGQTFEVFEGADWLPRELHGHSSAEPLVIPTAAANPATLAEIREDLTIMSRVLQKATGRTGERGDTMALGIVLSSFPALRRPQAMYLADYGAVFLLNVPFPLAAGSETTAAPPEKPTRTAWDEARRELYGPKPAPGMVRMQEAGPRTVTRETVMVGEILGGVRMQKAGPRQDTPFDAQRVERLQLEVTDALKNATNLRHLKPDEHIVVALTSTAASNTLVVRVKKAEVDDYAAGKWDRQTFAQRVTVNQY